MLRIMAPSISTAMLLLLPFGLLVAVILVVYPNELALQSSPTCQNNAGLTATDVVGVAVDFRLLIGVLTLPGLYERRNLIRTVYALQQPSLPASRIVDVRFIFCRVASEEERVLVALEAMRYGDVVELDCTENMDNGKTYSYLSSVPALFGASAYDFVMKTDDDTFFRLPQLAESLGRAPREDLYYGCRVSCDMRRAAKDEYMSGMGYVLSWDLVEWIAAAEVIRNRTAGPEDWTLRKWFGLGGKAKNWVDAKPAMYDFPQPRDACAHQLVPDTIAVHKLKDNERWSTTLKFFNFTAGLQPSKFFRNV
ncbi:beta-1,3-galactosyltransferase pvg3-like [Lolium perenne]|uniref:beta-1,3-galactosyltransferase pvg3-like n=1 Tax=Lolium perenne TaxID=4522 RepID=UPI0021EB0870|nr:beta-1,3-galactosyltransferase pvg3-like [Lolium perenne]